MPHTPITDQVRDSRGDYLAAVEELELSHADLLEVLKDLTALYMASPGYDPHFIAKARAAIDRAKCSR